MWHLSGVYPSRRLWRFVGTKRAPWQEEAVPDDLHQGTIIPLYKVKGSRSKCSKYKVMGKGDSASFTSMHQACSAISQVHAAEWIYNKNWFSAKLSQSDMHTCTALLSGSTSSHDNMLLCRAYVIHARVMQDFFL